MNDQNIAENWIKIVDGAFVCTECENSGKILTNTQDGLIEADVNAIKTDLEQFPSKIIYGVCPTCGMEYIFHLVNGELYLEPSEEEK